MADVKLLPKPAATVCAIANLAKIAALVPAIAPVNKGASVKIIAVLSLYPVATASVKPNITKIVQIARVIALALPINPAKITAV
jgi:hypothetical protein